MTAETMSYSDCLACGLDHEAPDLSDPNDADERTFRCPTTSRVLIVSSDGEVRLGDDRRARDYYPTPPALTRVMVEQWGLPPGTRVLEPCAGDGAIARVLEDYGAVVTTNDVNAEWECDYTGDFLAWPMRSDRPAPGSWDMNISNPPYQIAPEIVRAALQTADVVRMLLNVTWLEPCNNRHDLVGGMTRCLVLQRCKQTDITGGGGNNTTFAWFEWWRGRSGPCLTDFVFASEIIEAAGQGVLL